ncbi:SCO family protein [Lampropedia puyangensis]|uniref:SCO family protein n=1 Tax=Lampropedia puyangensis TaxID=1330072 RepID=A0A4S8F4S7_9BURK|nr:SCO family protein [Lampropedia puyangensis]THU01505.1 SCO family protein [Lampropedia puyangensis]
MALGWSVRGFAGGPFSGDWWGAVVRLQLPLLRFCFVVLLAAGLWGCQQDDAPRPAAFHGIDVTGASYAKDWSMPDANGQIRSLADFAGNAVYVFFGFAQCPDVCPTTMLEMAEVKRQLDSDAGRFQVVFVTVDPERDTPDVMRAYLSSFDEQAVALIGSAEQLAQMAKDFKVIYQKVPSDRGGYTMNHTAAGFLYDPQGRLRLYMRYGTPVSDVLADVQQLLAGQ